MHHKSGHTPGLRSQTLGGPAVRFARPPFGGRDAALVWPEERVSREAVLLSLALSDAVWTLNPW